MTSPSLIGQALDKVFRESKRDSLNKNPHFVPINIAIAELTLSSILRKAGEELEDPGIVSNVANIVAGIEAYVLQKHKGRLNIQNLPEDYIENPEKYLPAVVYSNGNIVGAMYGSYDKAYSGLFKDYLNKEVAKFISRKRYDDNYKQRQEEALKEGKVAKEYKVGYDVGHLISQNTPYATSPAYIKLTNALKSVEDLLNGNTSIGDENIPPGLITKHKTDLQKLKSSIQTNIDHLLERSVYGTQIAVELQKDIDLDRFLVRSKAVVVITQDRLENQYFFGTKLEGKVVNAVYQLLATVNYSKNIIEEIEAGFASIFTKVKNDKKSVKKNLPTNKVKPKPAKIKASSGAVTGVQKKSAKPTLKGPIVTANASLASLQSLLNATLIQKVKENMGSGSRKDILNLQSGRFAESVKVERLSESRQGMITAFYSYMKNPYATFSAGGKQGFPTSRDPKALISKSIREIAVTQVSNRLRSVNV